MSQIVPRRARSPTVLQRPRVVSAPQFSEDMSINADPDSSSVNVSDASDSRIRSASINVVGDSHNSEAADNDLLAAPTGLVNRIRSRTRSHSGRRDAESNEAPNEHQEENPQRNSNQLPCNGDLRNVATNSNASDGDFMSCSTIPHSERPNNLPPSCQEHRLRRKLKYFFMSPYEKYKTKRKIPFKLSLQVLKIALVTVQLVFFGVRRREGVDFHNRNLVTFEHLYLKDWDPALETIPYPAPRGPFAIYTIPTFYSYLDYAFTQYNRTKELAIGAYDFNSTDGGKPAPVLLLTLYNNLHTDVRKGEYTYSGFNNTKKESFDVEPVWRFNDTTHKDELVYDTKQFLKNQNKSIVSFDAFISATIKFSLRNIHFFSTEQIKRKPMCSIFDIEIKFDNSPNHGQVLVTLDSYYHEVHCSKNSSETRDSVQATVVGIVILSVVCLVISVMSLISTARSLLTSFILYKSLTRFFATERTPLKLSEKVELLNLWYVLILLTDVLVIIGSSCKIIIDVSNGGTDLFEICGLTLGVGVLFAWFGVLRYLTFFPKYNILILTMKRAAPNVLRYLVCALMLYAGFTFCGWVVLGPYHVKFQTLSSSSECLFSLLNGDDMFVTFSALQHYNSWVWYFSRAYLYIFISLFIYVVLSLFISVIMDTYETIKEYSETGFPESALDRFLKEDPSSLTDASLYREDDRHAPLVHRWLSCHCLRCACLDRHADDQQVLVL